MAGMKNHEQTFNAALGAVLQTRRRDWRDRVATEMSGGIVGGGRADNLIYPKSMQPVAVEAAFVNTANIDKDAIVRLGKTEAQTGREIMTAVAVAIPESVKKIKGGVDGMKAWLQKGGLLNYAVYSLVKDNDRELPGGFFDVRYPDGKPNSGYIRGTAADLADLIELAATPDAKIKQTAYAAVGAVKGLGASMLKDLHPTIRKKIADKVGQPPDMHAMNVAACIWLNALLLHSKLSAMRADKINSLRFCQTLGQTTEEWERILRIDYQSVFRPALESLRLLDGNEQLARHILSRLRGQVDAINSLYLGGVADVSSDMFPKLATDRKITAAYYTRMEVAELLAGMAFNLIPDGGDTLKIADFACGTGALLKAAYRQVRRRAEPKKEINMIKLHRSYMEECLHGADIQPIAAHLTAAGLAGMDPAADYSHSNIICTDIRKGKTGSLDLLKSESLHDLFESGTALGVDQGEHDFRPADNTFDLCIMNPPYSRPHGGRKIFGVEGVHPGERKKSVKAIYRHLSGTFANMRAGMASAFCLLADKKLKPGGVLAAVLPLTAAAQHSWRKFRSRMLNHYSDVVVVGMATKQFSSLSDETDMGEMLICARKNSGNGDGVLTIINLHQLPRDFVEAHEMARALRGAEKLKQDGELKIGEHVFATCVKARPGNGDPWGGVGAKNDEVAVIAKELVGGKLIKPGLVGEMKISTPTAAASSHLTVGPGEDHIGRPVGCIQRGAFYFHEIRRGDKVNLSLWKADCNSQIRMICEPTHRGRMNAGAKKLAEQMQNKRSILFIARNLRLTSQRLAAAMTEKPCMGGSAWAALLPPDKAACTAYCLWLNSLLGLMSMWQCGGKQHPGRARMTINDIRNFPCPAFAKKTAAAKKAVKIANKEFSRLAELDLMACSYAWRDNGRKEIDRVVFRMLGLEKKFSEDDIQTLREEWCREPSVHGGNKSILKALHADKLL